MATYVESSPCSSLVQNLDVIDAQTNRNPGPGSDSNLTNAEQSLKAGETPQYQLRGTDSIAEPHQPLSLLSSLRHLLPLNGK